TGDSMSMVSEACEVNKPVRLYFNSVFCSDKHITFCNRLIKEQYAFPFDSLGKKYGKIKVLNTSKKIALYIKKNLENE
ncbi:mitochondrial fission ELM1 family protein, partial [Alphaproteobacteria bacterium]|nr:mitochondrial fission ELM1 family protein [Alphaproteobacteria bacterium]